MAELLRLSGPSRILFILLFTLVLQQGRALGQTSRFVELPPAQRKPLVPRPLVFPRTQTQYSLYWNYAHWYTPEWDWIDRPLFFDASLTPPEGVGTKVYCPSFNRIIQTALPYEVDGFSLLIGLGTPKDRYLRALDCVTKHPVRNFSLVLGLAPTGKTPVEKAVANIGKRLQAALASPAARRIDGKVLIVSYRLDRDPPEKWAKIQTILRQKYGNSFLLIASIDSPWWAPYMRGKDGKVRADDLAKLKDTLRSWLDVCDGIMYSAAGHATDPTDDYKLDQGFYKFITQVCTSVLREPEYRHKYFGLQGASGYFRALADDTSNDNGTKYLRNTFRIALAAHPDFLILPEWDEVSENTCIEPTVYNSLSTQRVIRHIMRRLKGEPLRPMEKDDVQIPNLVLSYRPFLRVGRPLEVEVLNIPDGSAGGNYTVQLSLKDIHHKTIKRFAAATLGSDAMEDHTFHVPTEPLSEYQVVMPSLKVTSPDGTTRTFEDGLMCIRLNATANWNKKWVKTSLRDLLRPTTASFKRIDNRGPTTGPIQVSGSIQTDEKIMSVEVVADGNELYAVDPKRTYDLKPDEAILVMNESAPRRINDYNGKYYVTGGKIRQVVRQFFTWLARQPGNPSTNAVTHEPKGTIFVVTNKDKAVIHVENSVYKTQIPVSRILEKGFYSEVHGKGTILFLQSYHAVPEMPPPLRSRNASFTTQVNPVRPTTAIQMRVITESGKIYRSWPIMVTPASTGEAPLPIWSDTESKPVIVNVDRSRIVHIDASPDKMFGSTIHDSIDPSYYALAGGQPARVYALRNPGGYPKDAKTTAPRRVTEDGADCWSFDGKGNFLYFPPESLPRGAFTLSFRFKPMSEKRQVLLATYNKHPGPLQVLMDHGRLTAIYVDQRRRGSPAFHKISLDPDIGVPLGKWSTVQITYNLKNIIFKVNGKTAKPIPLSTTGWMYAPMIFGGYGQGNAYFKGFLQNLKIVHNAPIK